MKPSENARFKAVKSLLRDTDREILRTIWNAYAAKNEKPEIKLNDFSRLMAGKTLADAFALGQVSPKYYLNDSFMIDDSGEWISFASLDDFKWDFDYLADEFCNGGIWHPKFAEIDFARLWNDFKSFLMNEYGVTNGVAEEIVAKLKSRHSAVELVEEDWDSFC